MTILDRIIEHKRTEVANAKRQRSLTDVRRMAEALSASHTRRFRTALTAQKSLSLIAEVKKASPSKGMIRADFDPVALARDYVQGGAAAISVLTDSHFFQGGLHDLDAVRAAVDIPLLRKEFIIDPYQLYEARNHGADAALLIVAALDSAELREFVALATSLNLDALVEIHSEAELNIALEAGAELIGINNRDLRTFETTLDVSRRLAPLIDDGVTVVSESGISHIEHMHAVAAMGVDAVLVGEALAREADVIGKVSELLGRVRTP